MIQGIVWAEIHRLINYIVVASIVFYYIYSLLKTGGLRRGLKRVPSIDRFASCKSPCHYCRQSAAATVDVNMTSFRGYGRTGNYIRSLKLAIDLAVSCKKSVQMPKTDDMANAFIINSSCHVLDFSQRSGSENIFCQNISFPISGDAKYFWYLKNFVPDLTKDTREEYMVAKSNVLLKPCLQRYLGLCNRVYCQFEPKSPLYVSSKNVLVAHLREGDIFKSNFNSDVHGGYGQPPLSYYLQAIHYKHWRSIIVVTQPGNVGPIRSGLIMLNKTLQAPIHLQMSSWYDDLRTLLCAGSLITSKSTLEEIFKLGFASEIFSYRCLGTSQVGRDYFRIPIGAYSPFSNHTNSPTEWLEMLLHSSPAPDKC